MKIFLCAALVASLFVFNSCNVSTGTSNDLANGVSYTYSGVSIDRWRFTSGGVELPSNEVVYGQNFTFNLVGVNGFPEAGGKIKLQASLRILDKSGKVILENADLFKEDNDNGGLEAEKVKGELSLFVTIGSPLKVNEKYTAEFSIKSPDGKSEIKGSWKMQTVLPYGCRLTSNGIACEGVIFFTEPGKRILKDNILGTPEKLSCSFFNISGMNEENGMFFPDASIVVNDKEGKAVYNFPNLFEEYPDGVAKEDISSELPLSVSFGKEMVKGKQYTCIFTVVDRKSNGKVTSEMDFTW
jgi:hypothetical protein